MMEMVFIPLGIAIAAIGLIALVALMTDTRKGPIRWD
jgi:hypothetical protein